MQIKKLNAYRIMHKDGTIESISAENLIQALENVSVPEAESPVIQTFMKAEGIDTVMEELPSEVLFTMVVSPNSGNSSIATPASGKIHVGDSIMLKAVAGEGFDFDRWERNGEEVSREASFLYEMTPLAEGEDTAVFTAFFVHSPVAWETEVSPHGATGAGCVAFPASGVTEAGSNASMIAVEATGYTFDHWERNGETVGTNKILDVEMTPLAEGEHKAVFTAVFTEV